MKSMYRSVGDRYLFEANVSDRPAIVKSSLSKAQRITPFHHAKFSDKIQESCNLHVHLKPSIC